MWTVVQSKSAFIIHRSWLGMLMVKVYPVHSVNLLFHLSPSFFNVVFNQTLSPISHAVFNQKLTPISHAVFNQQIPPISHNISTKQTAKLGIIPKKNWGMQGIQLGYVLDQWIIPWPSKPQKKGKPSPSGVHEIRTTFENDISTVSWSPATNQPTFWLGLVAPQLVKYGEMLRFGFLIGWTPPIITEESSNLRKDRSLEESPCHLSAVWF